MLSHYEVIYGQTHLRVRLDVVRRLAMGAI